MILVYDVLVVLGTLLIAPFYVWRYRKTPFLRESWRERLGYFPESLRATKPGAIWVHAVSVGETLAVAGLVERLSDRLPEREIFISHVTPTGRESGEKRLPRLAGRFYLPIDLPGPICRALRRIRPALLLIVETEIWPNLLRMAHRSGARVVLVNARLSDRSCRGYRFFRPFFSRTLESADLIMAQTEKDRKRFVGIGGNSARTVTTGNLKFDTQPPAETALVAFLKKELSGAARCPIIVAASTMPGEEPIVLELWQSVQHLYPQALLVLAPRHPARFDSVAQLVASRGGELIRRSNLCAEERGHIGRLSTAAVLLLDSLGELASVFELADLVVMGGSFVPTGGHNLLEPAWWGKPVIFGPHMENFRDAARLFLDAGAAVQVRNPAELERESLGLLRDPERARAIGERAREVMQRESGVTEYVLDQLLRLLGEDRGEPVRSAL